jgi:hypothetical protein
MKNGNRIKCDRQCSFANTKKKICTRKKPVCNILHEGN